MTRDPEHGVGSSVIGPVLGCLRVSGPASFSVGVASCPVPGPALTVSPAKTVFFGDLLEEAKRTKIAVFEQPFHLGRPPELLRSSGPNTTKRPWWVLLTFRAKLRLLLMSVPPHEPTLRSLPGRPGGTPCTCLHQGATESICLISCG